MKRIILPFLCAMLSATAACGAESQTSVSGRFHSITVSDNIDLYYTVGAPVKVTINAPKRLIGQVKAEVKADGLKVYTTGKIKLKEGEKLKVFVTAPAVSGFTATDNSDIYVQSALNGDKISVTVRDNSDFKSANITASEIDLRAYDNSDIKVRGTVLARKATLTSQDNSDISAFRIDVHGLSMKSGDNSEIKCKDTKAGDVVARATDNSEIELAGTAVNVTLTASDMSEIDADKLNAQDGTATATDMATVKACSRNLKRSTSDMGKVKNQSR